MDEEERRRKVHELLVPGGEPVGRPGRQRADIRVQEGGYEVARELLRELEELGEREDLPGYDGISINPGGRDRVGLRKRSGSGWPTIDVTISYVPELWKIKFE